MTSVYVTDENGTRFYTTCDNFPEHEHEHDLQGEDNATEVCVPVDEASWAVYYASYDAYYEQEPEPYPIPEWVVKQRSSNVPDARFMKPQFEAIGLSVIANN